MWAWVREQQVSAILAWSCVLGIDLQLTAYPGSTEYLQATSPLSADLVLGSDLDPASNEDLRSVVAQTLKPDGYVVAGIQQTENPGGKPEEAEEGTEAAAKTVAKSHHHHHHHGLHDHTSVKGNAYNFATTPQHAASFDLLQGQLAGLPCLRTEASTSLGCVEGSYNWFASMCELGPHLGGSASLGNALREFTSGWPMGTRLSEKCVLQRHFLGYVTAEEEEWRGRDWRQPPQPVPHAAADGLLHVPRLQGGAVGEAELIRPAWPRESRM